VYLKRMLRKLYPAVPVFLFVALWQLISTVNPETSKFFSSPLEVFRYFLSALKTGSYVEDVKFSLLNVLAGYFIGNVLGVFSGLGLWFSEECGRTFRPLIHGFSAIPIFALAPMTILWWGTGVEAKVIIVFLHVYFLSVLNAYKGAQTARKEFASFFKALGANNWQLFYHIVLPSASVWIFSTLKVTANFAVLGEFIAEFIVSERGVGHYIVRATGLYDVPGVITGTLTLMFFSFLLMLPASYLEKKAEKRFLGETL